MTVFLNDLHEQRFYTLLDKDDLLGKKDIEREALFFILSGNQELYRCASNIYNFRGRRLQTNVWARVEGMCTSTQNLLKLAINLYNGNRMSGMDPCELLRYLDRENLRLAISAMYIRFA